MLSFKDRIKIIADNANEAENELLKEYIKTAKNIATIHYNKIKESLIKSAKDEEYEFIDDKKFFAAEHIWNSSEIEYGMLLSYFPMSCEKKFLLSEHGIKYVVKDERIFSEYISEIKKLSEEDEISVSLCGKYSENGEEKYFSIPGELRQIGKISDTERMFKEISVVLKAEMYL